MPNNKTCVVHCDIATRDRIDEQSPFPDHRSTSPTPDAARAATSTWHEVMGVPTVVTLEGRLVLSVTVRNSQPAIIQKVSIILTKCMTSCATFSGVFVIRSDQGQHCSLKDRRSAVSDPFLGIYFLRPSPDEIIDLSDSRVHTRAKYGIGSAQMPSSKM
jgi:hypothetical protein